MDLHDSRCIGRSRRDDHDVTRLQRPAVGGAFIGIGRHRGGHHRWLLSKRRQRHDVGNAYWMSAHQLPAQRLDAAGRGRADPVGRSRPDYHHRRHKRPPCGEKIMIRSNRYFSF